jgi:hypothetical protein
MDSFRDLILRWPSAEALAGDLGLLGVTVRQWGARNSIPPAYWPGVIASAAARGIPGVTLEAMARLAVAAAPKARRTAGVAA